MAEKTKREDSAVLKKETNAKRLKTDVIEEDFTTEGLYDDEVTLTFENGEKCLYVARNFLKMSSPVFAAMFRHDFKEKRQKKINMTAKNYDDFLEFLQCMHPRLLKPIDEENVLRIAPVAEEYQVDSLVKKCQENMKSILNKYTKRSLYCVKQCLEIFSVALALNYDQICQNASETVAKYPLTYYADSPSYCSACYELFYKLPLQWKYDIMHKRAFLSDKSKSFVGY